MAENNKHNQTIEMLTNKLNSIYKEFDEVKNLRVSLSDDPISIGLSTHLQKIAMCREFANRIATVLLKSIKLKSEIESIIKIQKAILEINSSKLFIEVSGKTITDKEMAVKVEVRDLSMYIAELESLLINAKALNESVYSIYEMINKTNKDLVAQLAVIKQQILIGEIKLSKDSKIANYDDYGIDESEIFKESAF